MDVIIYPCAVKFQLTYASKRDLCVLRVTKIIPIFGRCYISPKNRPISPMYFRIISLPLWYDYAREVIMTDIVIQLPRIHKDLCCNKNQSRHNKTVNICTVHRIYGFMQKPCPATSLERLSIGTIETRTTKWASSVQSFVQGGQQ